MRPTSDYVVVDTVAGLVSATGQTVLVRPCGMLYGFSPAVIRYVPEVRQWTLGYLSHDLRRVVRMRLFVSGVDMLDKMCIMRKP